MEGLVGIVVCLAEVPPQASKMVSKDLVLSMTSFFTPFKSPPYNILKSLIFVLFFSNFNTYDG